MAQFPVNGYALENFVYADGRIKRARIWLNTSVTQRPHADSGLGARRILIDRSISGICARHPSYFLLNCACSPAFWTFRAQSRLPNRLDESPSGRRLEKLGCCPFHKETNSPKAEKCLTTCSRTERLTSIVLDGLFLLKTTVKEP